MKHTLFLLVASFGLLAACSDLNEFGFQETIPLDKGGELVERVIFEVPVIRSLGDDDETRASLSQEGDNAIRFAWEATDTVGIYPDRGAQVFFSMENGVGTNVASFDGGGWALREESTYSCYYPFVGDMYLKREAIPVSFADQQQSGVSSYEGIRFYLASEGTSSESGALHFTFQMLNTVIRIKAIGLPAGTYTKMSMTTDEDLFVQEGTFGLEDMTITGEYYSNTLEVSLNEFTLTKASTEANPVLIYLTSAPVDLRGHTVTVQLHSEDGSVYSCEKTPSMAYEAGAWGGLKCVIESAPVAEIIEFADPLVKRICVENWDTNGDGELDRGEAAAVTDLGTVFRDNTSITSFEELRFFTGLTRIGDNAFSDCSNLTGSLTIPEGVTEIGREAFYRCSGFTGSLVLPEGLTSIGYSAFKGCRGFTGPLVIPDGVTSLENLAFESCSGFTSLTIPDSVTSLGEFTFGFCSGFTGPLVIPNGVTSIDFEAFESCSGFTSLTIPDGVTIIGEYAFSGCSGFTGSLTIPEGVTSIRAGAFFGCSGFTGSLVLPEGLTYVGYGAFYNCSGFTDLTIPDSVTSIGDNAFNGCSGFTGIISKGETPPSGHDYMFTNTNNCPIYVPIGSVEKYKAAEYWSDYADRIQAVPFENLEPIDGSDDPDIDW